MLSTMHHYVVQHLWNHNWGWRYYNYQLFMKNLIQIHLHQCFRSCPGTLNISPTINWITKSWTLKFLVKLMKIILGRTYLAPHMLQFNVSLFIYVRNLFFSNPRKCWNSCLILRIEAMEPVLCFTDACSETTVVY